jgi:protein involved in polysaccharide export with SLBB domain
MRVRVVRHDGTIQEANLFRAVFQQSEEDNPALQDGDFIFVPSLAMGTRKVYVLGEVNQPGVVTIYDSMNLVEALARCGGIGRRGDLKEIVVIKRTSDGKPDMRIANVKALYKEGALAQNIPLDPGDIVYVPKGALGTMQDVFSIISPALQTIESLYIIDSFMDE